MNAIFLLEIIVQGQSILVYNKWNKKIFFYVSDWLDNKFSDKYF